MKKVLVKGTGDTRPEKGDEAGPRMPFPLQLISPLPVPQTTYLYTYMYPSSLFMSQDAAPRNSMKKPVHYLWYLANEYI
jgi:hypothetical protein